MGFLVRLIANALAILTAAYIMPGIQVSGGLAVLAAALVLALVNAIVRPILLLRTLPFTLLTVGLFSFFPNAFCLCLTFVLVQGFEVQGFWTAVGGAIIVSIVSWIVTVMLSDRGRVVVITDHKRTYGGDVIDITPKK